MNRESKPGYKRTEVGVIPEDWEVMGDADRREDRALLRAAHENPLGQLQPRRTHDSPKHGVISQEVAGMSRIHRRTRGGPSAK